MKKFFSLFAAVLLAGSMFSEVFTLTMADFAATEFKDDVSGISVATAKNNGSTQPAYNATGKDLRIYAKGDITISAARPIEAISFEISAQGKKRLAELTADGGTVTVKGDPDFTAAWAGNAASVKLTVGDKAVYGTDGAEKAGQLCFTAISVTLGGEAPAVYAPKIEAPQDVFYKELEVTITCATAGASIYYTLDGTDPSYVGALLYEGPFKINETTKVRAVAEKGDDYSSKVEKTFTKGEVWSVTRAISELDMTSPLANKFVKGKIVELVEYKSDYKSITYWIEDLDTPDVKLEVYSGLGLNGAEFSALDDLKLGQVVTVFGDLKIYKKEGQADIYEFDKNNFIVDFNGTQSISNTSVETKAVKTIRNGVLVIEKNGIRYNAFGQNVR